MTIAQVPAASSPLTGRAAAVAGWTLTGLFTAFMLFDCGIKLARLPIVEQTGAQMGLPPGSGFPIGVGEAALLGLYLWPRTSVLGAVLFTGLFATPRCARCSRSAASGRSCRTARGPWPWPDRRRLRSGPCRPSPP
jgi:hypothetical protein